jgi:hypothetical protein
MAGFWHSTWKWLQRRHLESDPAMLAAAARARSLQLLDQNLSYAQRLQFARYNYFEVIGSDTAKRYRIGAVPAFNVAELDESGSCERLLCFGPRGGLPIGDVMLAQKMALELYETEAISVANTSALFGVGMEPTSLRILRRI